MKRSDAEYAVSMTVNNRQLEDGSLFYEIHSDYVYV